MDEPLNRLFPTPISIYITERMKENEEFLLSNASDAVGEVVNLINDSIDEIGYAIGRTDRKKDYFERSMAFFIQHILSPFSYSIYLDLIAANLPICIVELRLMLESLVKCYLADSKYLGPTSFRDKLASLEREEWNVSRLMKKLGRILGLEDEPFALWTSLSQNWVHTQGLATNVLEDIIHRKSVPPWALVIPMPYNSGDLDAIEELRTSIIQFRKVLNIAMQSYRQDLGYGED